jgi:hypothetical protein
MAIVLSSKSCSSIREAFGSFCTSFSPKVGHCGVSASKSQTGKLESIPPSTMRCSPPVSRLANRTGSKKMGMLMLMRTASATSMSSGSWMPSLGASLGNTRRRRSVTSEAITCSL